MRTHLPPPMATFRSLSIGACSPILGSSASGIGGGGGESHGWTVRGRFLTVIHAGQAEAFSSSSSTGPFGSLFLRSFGGGSFAGEEKLKVSEERPTFLRASFVARLENIVDELVSSATSLTVPGEKRVRQREINGKG